MIRCIRVDFRLVHGQIIHSWLKSTNSNRICILDDALVHEPYKMKMFKMCVPPYVKLEIYSINEGIERLKKMIEDKKACYLVVLKDILSCIKVCNALNVTSFNIGETIYAPDKKRLANSVYATNQEIKAMNDFLVGNRIIEIQQVFESHKLVFDSRKKLINK